VASLVQLQDGWHGASFILDKNIVKDVRIYDNIDPGHSRNFINGMPVYISFGTSLSYFVHLKFPFTGKRKIELVLNSELSGILPVDISDVVVDFKEIGKGSVLAVALPKDDIAELTIDKGVRGVTVNAIATLQALKWLNAIPQNDFVFIHIDGNNASLVAQRKGNLQYLRQFYCSVIEPGSIHSAIKEIKVNEEFSQIPFYMISSGVDGDIAALKTEIERQHNIKIMIPSIRRYIAADNCPEWLWAAIGSSLMMRDGNEINLLPQKEKGLKFSNEIVLKVLGVAAIVSVLVFAMLLLNFYSKEKTFRFLMTEQQQIYRAIFPKSPPIKDIVKGFQDKIRLLDRELAGTGVVDALPALKILAEISNKIDKQIDVRLNEFVCDEKEFSISGTTVSYMAVEKIKASIEEIKELNNIEIQNIDIAPGKQVKFKIRGRFL
jgi:hypothetical protein